MRDFNEADRAKKKTRIQISENPGNLSREMLLRLENAVKASARDNHLPCGTTHRIARDLNVPKITVGEMADRLGIRITNCQIGCFTVDKSKHGGLDDSNTDENIASVLDALNRDNKLDCAHVFEVAAERKLTPMAVAEVANSRRLRITHCQLGCF